MTSDLQADRNILTFTCRLNTEKMVSQRINIEVSRKKFGVGNKEYHGHAYMHQT